MKANCPNAKKPVGSIEQAAIMDRTVDFGCLEVEKSSKQWATPKRSAPPGDLLEAHTIRSSAW